MMLPEEFKEKMQDINKKYENDVEAKHSKMDDLMCEVLKQHGYDEGIDVFEKTELWYS